MARAARVELRRLELPLASPISSAHGTEDRRWLIVVRLRLEDGIEGWGECSALSHPTYTSEYTAGAWAVLRDELVPRFFRGRPWGVFGHQMASAALLTAEADADLRRIDRRLADQLGLMNRSEPRSVVTSRAVVGRPESIDGVLAEVAARLAEGHRAVKLKLAPRRLDLDALASVRATWPDLDLAADANGSLSAGDGAVLDRIDALGLTYLEQPLPADDLEGSAAVVGRLVTPVALDESVTSEAAARTVIGFDAAGVLNVKPARVGGPVEAARIVKTAADRGVPAFVGGMYESGIGRAVGLAVAALPGCTIATDLGPSARYLDPDLTEPVVLEADGTLAVPTGPGIGVRPDPDRLDAVTVESLELSS